MQMSNKCQCPDCAKTQLRTRSNYSPRMPSHYQNNVNMKIGGNRMIHGGMASVSLAECPDGAYCENQTKVWTQNIIPIAANIRTTTRQQADMIRGDIDISSPQGPLGWFHTAGANRRIEKGARGAVFGVR